MFPSKNTLTQGTAASVTDLSVYRHCNDQIHRIDMRRPYELQSVKCHVI